MWSKIGVLPEVKISNKIFITIKRIIIIIIIIETYYNNEYPSECPHE